MGSRASANFRRVFLRSLAWDAEDNGIALHDGLKAAARASIADTGTGKVLVGATANGTAVSYQVPANGVHLSPVEIAETVEGFLTGYETAVAGLGESPTDTDILAAMLAAIVAVRSVSPDFSGATL